MSSAAASRPARTSSSSTTGLLADCQDAHQEEREHNHRLHVALTRAEMQLAGRDARIRELEAALSAAGAERDGDEPPGPHPPG